MNMDLLDLALIGAGILVIGIPLVDTVVRNAKTEPEPTPHETLTIDAEPTVPFDVGMTIVQAQPTPGVDHADLIRRETEHRELPILWSMDEIQDEDTEPSRPDAAE